MLSGGGFVESTGPYECYFLELVYFNKELFMQLCAYKYVRTASLVSEIGMTRSVSVVGEARDAAGRWDVFIGVLLFFS